MSTQATKLFLCGDVMTGRGVDQILPHPSDPAIHEPHLRDAREYVWIAEQANGAIGAPVAFSYVWGDALAELERRAPDARIVNLETSITRNPNPSRNKDVHYRMHPANVACLADARIDVCALANNHVLDYGRAGLFETVDVLAAANIGRAGAGRNADEAWTPAIAPLPGGGRVVVFAVAATSSGVPEEWAARHDHAGVALVPELSDVSAARLIERIAAVRRPGDLVVVSIHWGKNWGWSVDHDEIRFAHRLVDGGVDVVHGHSSHHARPIELYQGRLILYGCGDFVDDYEGITGYEEYRDDLRLMYFATCDATTGELTALELVPLQSRQLRLVHASDADRGWMHKTLERISRPFGTRFDVGGDGRTMTVVVPPLRQPAAAPRRTVRSLMSAPVETIDAGESVAAAARRLRDANVGILPVVERGELVGVLTDRDVVTRVVAADRIPDATAVRDVMTEGVATCREDDATATAAERMLHKAIRRLVVLDRAGRVAGVLSVDDLAMLGAEEEGAGLVSTSVPAHPLID